MRGSRLTAGLLAAGMLVASATTASAEVDKKVTVTGAGATFPLNIIEQWKADFKKSTGATISYTGVGSGAGRSQLVNGTVDFAGSDAVASAAETSSLKSKYGDFVYIPETSGGIALAFNVPGVTALKLSAPTIAGIFSGNITRWNDSGIANDGNSGLPNTPIQVIVRSDSSGTSNAFTSYLATAAGSSFWRHGTQNVHPTDRGQIARNGNDGVATGIQSTTGGIGYVEVSFAKERGLPMASVKNEADKFVQPTADAVKDAITDSKINDAGIVDLVGTFTSAKPSAYPISTVSYLLVPTRMDEAKGTNLKAFMHYILTDGQKKAELLHYAPIPANIQERALANLDRVAGEDPRPKAAPVTTAKPNDTTAKPKATTAKKVAKCAKGQKSTQAKPCRK